MTCFFERLIFEGFGVEKIGSAGCRRLLFFEPVDRAAGAEFIFSAASGGCA